MAEKANELMVLLKENKAAIEAFAPPYLNKNRAIAIFIEASKNEKLQYCTPISFLAAAKKMFELGTEIIGSGGVHLVPFGKVATVIVDWRLIVTKAVSAGVIKHATATVVHAGDEFEYEYGLEPRLRHVPSRKDKQPMTDVYCVYVLPDGEKQFLVMSKTEVDFIRSKSKAGSSGPWVDYYEEMAKKTVIRRALKVFEGVSPELSKVIDQDNATVGFMEVDFGEPIAEPRAINAKAETLAPEKEKKAEPTKEKKAEKKEETGAQEINYAEYLGEDGLRKIEVGEMKLCANELCVNAGHKILCGTVTGLCLNCLKKKVKG
jgi:recombination protein RecT